MVSDPLPGLSSVGVGDADVLGGGVFGDTFGSAFTAEAGLFDAAEGCCGVGDDPCVEPDHAELDLLSLRRHGSFDGGVEVGVVEHDERCVSAELHRGAEHVLRGVGHQPLAHRGGSSEGDLLYVIDIVYLLLPRPTRRQYQFSNLGVSAQPFSHSYFYSRI
jgi:hypothetical protein